MNGSTKIYSVDFEVFVSHVATDVWNHLVHAAHFEKLEPRDYVTLHQFLSQALSLYRQKDDFDSASINVPN